MFAGTLFSGMLTKLELTVSMYYITLIRKFL